MVYSRMLLIIVSEIGILLLLLIHEAKEQRNYFQ